MVENILSKITLNKDWVSVNMNSFNDCYVIAIKGDKGKKDTIDPQDVRIITFEMSIDSGIEGKPITISRFSLNFNEITSSDDETNKLTAFVRLLNIPSKFYLKPVAVDDGSKSITTGETTISININPVSLG